MRLLEWSHTDYYHPLLLRHVPERAERALDVGCGTGRFARELAKRVRQVDAIDLSPEAIAIAEQRSRDVTNVRFRRADLLTDDMEPAAYNYVSCLMVIHHVPFEPALERLSAAVKPGGVLAILGLGRMDLADLPVALAILPLDIAMGLRFKVAAWLGRPTLSGVGPEAPVANPTMRTKDIRLQSSALLPGATFKRHVFYRYSLVYRRES
jgi:SAM-dependent methyltransferase